MLVIEYTKKFPVSAISHIDLLRVFQRIIRRAKIDVEYSQGFNPHMRIFFSPPTPLGMETLCEYVTIETSTNYGKDFLNQFNAVCPEGIKATEIYNFAKNPNFAKIITRAEYCINAPDIGKINLSDMIDNSDYTIEYLDKQSVLQTQKAGEMIFEAESLNNDCLRVVLSFGNKNLRAERLVKYLCNQNNINYSLCKITKTKAFADDIPIEKMLKSFN